jgi:hypothetical protein
MDDFLTAITLGEFVAAANAQLIAAFFRQDGDGERAAAYAAIARDETRHFGLLRDAGCGRGRLPADMRRIYKGEFLEAREGPTLDCVYERLSVMHTVFEGAAFAYMSLLAREQGLDRAFPGLALAARAILVDEAEHMACGFSAIEALRSRVSRDRQVRTESVAMAHAAHLRPLPAQTLGRASPLGAAVVSLYDVNVAKNLRRLLQ